MACRSRFVQVRLLPAAGLLLAGCAVRPKCVRPAAPVPPAYKEAPQAYKSDVIWKPAQPGDSARHTTWWELFGDDQLNSLERQVDVGNQELKSAESHFREARALAGFARAAAFPPPG